MTDRFPLKHFSAFVGAVLMFTQLVSGLGAQQDELREECSDCLESGALSDQPQVFHTSEQTFRVVPMKGLSRPWALEFLPNGDMLITERAGRLRIVRDGVLDPEPIAGIPQVIRTMRKGLMDIKYFLCHVSCHSNMFTDI